MATNYYGSFSLHGSDLFRWDTRVYLDRANYDQSQGVCVGAVVGINPGSALPLVSGWGPIDIGVDNTLPTILRIFNKAYSDSAGTGLVKPPGAFVQILNLFYLRDADPTTATAKIKRYRHPPICSSELNLFPVVWFAWSGQDKSLDQFKSRYDSVKAANCFYYRGDKGPIVKTVPSINDHAHHPLYLQYDEITPHLATTLNKLV